MAMRTIKLTLMYDGTNYVGWQNQPNGVSVQSLVERAVRTMTGEGNDVVAASRTDAGVHALGQVAHFETGRSIPLEGFRRGLNALLPGEIAVVRAEEAPAGFHARRDARAKRYAYRIVIAPGRNPILRDRAWWVKGSLDAQRMREAADGLVGEHDFTSFRAAGSTSRHAVRSIMRIAIEEGPLPAEALAGEGTMVDVVVEGNGFVRHMVRNIVGTLVDVGSGRLGPQDMGRILAARGRAEAGGCAPACGLYLVRVLY